MTALFRPWTEEVTIGKSDEQEMTQSSLIPTKDELWLSEAKKSDASSPEESVIDREIRYKSVKEHIRKRSEKNLLKRYKVNDDLKPETTCVKTEPRQENLSSKPETFCPEMGCGGFQVPCYPTPLDSGLGFRPVDFLNGENAPTCIVPTYGPIHPGSELLDAAFVPSFPSNLFEEYAKFLTDQQKQVAERTRKQRPKKFRCPHCQVGFSNNGQLKGHIRIHTGERPFKCDAEACGKSFTRNEELTRHRRIHSGLRPFPCPECGKRFGRKDHLKKHVKTHFQQRYQLVPILSSHCPYFGYGL